MHDSAGHVAKRKPEFDRRRVKVIELSVDSISDHDPWAQDMEDTQGARPNYPIIGDSDFTVSKLISQHQQVRRSARTSATP